MRQSWGGARVQQPNKSEMSLMLQSRLLSLLLRLQLQQQNLPRASQRKRTRGRSKQSILHAMQAVYLSNKTRQFSTSTFLSSVSLIILPGHVNNTRSYYETIVLPNGLRIGTLHIPESKLVQWVLPQPSSSPATIRLVQLDTAEQTAHFPIFMPSAGRAGSTNSSAQALLNIDEMMESKAYVQIVNSKRTEGSGPASHSSRCQRRPMLSELAALGTTSRSLPS